jgi:hypothetical protein
MSTAQEQQQACSAPPPPPRIVTRACAARGYRQAPHARNRKTEGAAPARSQQLRQLVRYGRDGARDCACHAGGRGSRLSLGGSAAARVGVCVLSCMAMCALSCTPQPKHWQALAAFEKAVKLDPKRPEAKVQCVATKTKPKPCSPSVVCFPHCRCWQVRFHSQHEGILSYGSKARPSPVQRAPSPRAPSPQHVPSSSS